MFKTFDELIENLKQLPEDAFRVFGEHEAITGWLPYLTVFNPVQICHITPGNFSVKPVGDVSDIFWHRNTAEESIIRLLIQNGGKLTFNFADSSDAIKALAFRGIIETGFADVNGDSRVTLASPRVWLEANPEWNRHPDPSNDPLYTPEPEPLRSLPLSDFCEMAKDGFYANNQAFMNNGQYEIVSVKPYKPEPYTYTVSYVLVSNGAKGMGEFPDSTRVTIKPTPGRMSLDAYYDYTGDGQGYILKGDLKILTVRPHPTNHALYKVWYETPEGNRSDMAASPTIDVIIKPKIKTPAHKPMNGQTRTDASINDIPPHLRPVFPGLANLPPANEWVGAMYQDNKFVGTIPADLPPARPVPVDREDLITAVRNYHLSGGKIDQTKLVVFLMDVLGDDQPEKSPDPKPLIEALQAIEAGATGDYEPAQIAGQALYAYKTGAGH